jgi:uncharacterized protein
VKIVSTQARPAIGIGYRSALAEWTRANLACFDVLEITVDHCIHGGVAQRAEIFDLSGRIPLNAHGVGLSIGTDAPLDLAYLGRVAAIVERLGAPTYSEHLAFTLVPGRDLANLLPLPRTEAVAEMIAAKVRAVQARIPVPFLLENISYVFDWPDSHLTDAEFLNLICRETGAGLLLDIENLHLNASNHGFDAHAFLGDLTPGLVREIHMAGGLAVPDTRLPSRSSPIPTRIRCRPKRSNSSIACSRATPRRPSSWSATTASTRWMKSSMMSRASGRELTGNRRASMAKRVRRCKNWG